MRGNLCLFNDIDGIYACLFQFISSMQIFLRDSVWTTKYVRILTCNFLRHFNLFT